LKVDLEALRVLDVIVREGSFAKAAESLHKAQSAISYQIKKLEEQLNIQVFDRSGYRAQLTPAGKALWQEGQRMLMYANRIESLGERFAEGWEPRLEVVIDGALPTEPIMQALKVMVQKAIPTRIQVKTEFLGGVAMRFREDSADLMLVNDHRPSPDLTARPLPPTTMVLVAASDHPLAGMQQLDIGQLQDYVELTVHDSSDPTKQTLDPLQFGGDRMFFLSDFVSKKNALLMGLGFGWVPEALIYRELSEGTLVELDYPPGSRVALEPQLVYPADRPLGKAGTLVCDLLEQYFAEFHLSNR